jgi:signal transduction histidine kinase
VSHDLRNPLNVAQLSLDGLETDDPEALARAQRALDRMADIVDDVLALARADEAVESTTPVSLDGAVRDAWTEVTEDDATLVVEAEATIEADRGRLDRAIENLLRNAVQHGGSDVTVRVGTHGDGFYVADDGPGIPPDERDEIFESGYSTAEQGTGFGLDLVRQAVDAHGWAVDVTESADGGARFEVSGIDGLDG